MFSKIVIITELVLLLYITYQLASIIELLDTLYIQA